MIAEIAEAIKSIFSFLTAERDPDKQLKRIHKKEYAILKKAVKYAVLAFQFERLAGEEKIKNKRQYYLRLARLYKRKFYTLLAEE